MTEAEVIRVERRVPVSPAIVFSYLVDPALTERWLGLASMIEAHPGGRFSLDSPNGMTARGTVAEVIPGAKVSFTWGWDGHPGVPPGSTLVEIELFADGEGTLVVLTHRRLPESEHNLHVLGWTHYLERLATAAGGGDPGPDLGVTGASPAPGD